MDVRLIDLDEEKSVGVDVAATPDEGSTSTAGGVVTGNHVTFSGELEDVQSFDNTLPVEQLTTAPTPSSSGAGASPKRKRRRNRRDRSSAGVDRKMLM